MATYPLTMDQIISVRLRYGWWGESRILVWPRCLVLWSCINA